MDDLLADFVTESLESLSELDLALVKLERAPDDQQTLSLIFRLVHTIKGTCGFLGLTRLAASSSHAVENGARRPAQPCIAGRRLRHHQRWSSRGLDGVKHHRRRHRRQRGHGGTAKGDDVPSDRGSLNDLAGGRRIRPRLLPGHRLGARSRRQAQPRPSPPPSEASSAPVRRRNRSRRSPDHPRRRRRAGGADGARRASSCSPATSSCRSCAAGGTAAAPGRTAPRAMPCNADAAAVAASPPTCRKA